MARRGVSRTTDLEDILGEHEVTQVGLRKWIDRESLGALVEHLRIVRGS